ncbi:MAG: PorT family protein [Bacteroidales bacterium]|nr:PorT family protein [Bacteroidales bacterium]
MKTRIICILILIFLGSDLSAQYSKTVKNLPQYDNKLWHFGFTVGCNNMGFKIDRSDDFFALEDMYGIEAEKFTGFHIGPISSLRICKYLDLRMMFNLSFNQRDLVYYFMEGDKTEMKNHRMSINSTMLEFPVLFKYKAERWGNFSPYLVAGANYKYDLAADKKPRPEEMPKIKLLKHDPCAEWGAGFDIYLQYFKLSLELKYSVGLLNTLKRDNTPYTDCINKLSSNALIFSIHFE